MHILLNSIKTRKKIHSRRKKQEIRTLSWKIYTHKLQGRYISKLTQRYTHKLTHIERRKWGVWTYQGTKLIHKFRNFVMYRDIHKTFENFTKLLKTLQREKIYVIGARTVGRLLRGLVRAAVVSIRFFGCSRTIAPGVGDQRAGHSPMLSVLGWGYRCAKGVLSLRGCHSSSASVPCVAISSWF